MYLYFENQSTFMIVRIYLIAFIWYAIITLPTLIGPIVYIYSLFLAFIYGFIALLIFSIVYACVYKIRSPQIAWTLLIVSIPTSVIISFIILCYSTDYSKPTEAGWLLCFPLVAIISGWISLGLNKKTINHHFFPKENTN